MLTNNYLEYRKMMFTGAGMNAAPDPHNNDWKVVGTNGSTLSGLNAQYSGRGDLGWWMNKGRCQAITSANTTKEAQAGVFFGSGSTPASPDDYTLESPIISGLTITNTNQLYLYNEDENGSVELTGTFLLQNTSDAEINISEMGIITAFGSGISSGTIQFLPVLMERTVLPEPVSIQPGCAKVITYKVRQNLAINAE